MTTFLLDLALFGGPVLFLLALVVYAGIANAQDKEWAALRDHIDTVLAEPPNVKRV